MLKSSKLEAFRPLKSSDLEDFRALKIFLTNFILTPNFFDDFFFLENLRFSM